MLVLKLTLSQGLSEFFLNLIIDFLEYNDLNFTHETQEYVSHKYENTLLQLQLDNFHIIENNIILDKAN